VSITVCEAAARALGALGDASAAAPLRAARSELDKRKAIGLDHARRVLSEALRSCEHSKL
jgi:hypothetical protein